MKRLILIIFLLFVLITPLYAVQPCGSKIKTVNEDSTCWLTFQYIDEDGNPAIPMTSQYRIDDVASGTEIVPTTVISPLSSAVTITVPSTANFILNAIKEERLVTVEWSDGTNTKYDNCSYWIINLEYVPMPAIPSP